MAPKLDLLVGDKRTTEFLAWDPWLSAAARLVGRFDDELDDDPLAYNETASVSLLASAATQVGYLGLAEFSVTKGSKADRRKSAKGRCDLWIASDTRTWGFEFKQRAPQKITDAIWLKAMDEAKACARCLRQSEADERVAGLIVSLYWHEQDDLARARSAMRELAACCHYAWELKGRGQVASDTFFFFDVVGR
jgi:hypothetical protein